MNVRWAMAAMLDDRSPGPAGRRRLAKRFLGPIVLLAVLASPAPPTALAEGDQPRVTIAMLPAGTSVAELTAALPDAAPGVLSAGLGEIPASQTYLDIGQGARLAGSLYDERVPPLYVTGNRVSATRWGEVVARAETAPANISPGLLASTLEDAGVPITAAPLAGSPALLAVDAEGRVRRTSMCNPGACPGVSVSSIVITELPEIAARIRQSDADLLIALERPPTERDLLAVAFLGGGFTGGNLTSASTRMDGYVLATDLLPTVLGRYGIAVPDEATGRVIEAGDGVADAAAVATREARLAQISDRRSPVLAVNVLIWVGLALIAAATLRRRGAVAALVLLATSLAWLPALLLLTAAVEPSGLAERLIVGIGAPLAAAASLMAMRRPLGARAPYGAFALAAAVSIGATAIDVIAGSPLTALSLIGPNPGYGVRFFGIGNELEATIASLLMLGCGTAVTTLDPRDARKVFALTVTVATLAAVLVFAPGRLGADVGAAITFPAGAAAAVIVALRLGTRRAVLVLAAPIVAVIALVGIDLALGGDAHLSRSVLQAGGLDELGDVFERRISLGASSFTRAADSPLFIASLATIGIGFVLRRRIGAWFVGRPAASAGAVGAIAATVIGTLSNDSGALLLMVGTGFVAAFCGLAWAAANLRDSRPPR